MEKGKWITVYGIDTWTEDGKIKRAKRDDKTVYPYRASRFGGWSLDQDMTPDAFRAAYRRGTAMFS